MKLLSFFEEYKNQKLAIFLSVWIFVFPFIAIGVRSSLGELFLISLLISVWYSIKNYRCEFTINKLWKYSAWILLLYVLATLLWTEVYANAPKHIGFYVKFLFVFPLLILFYHYRFVLFKVFKLSVIFTGPFLIIITFTVEHFRFASPNLDPIKYGLVALLFFSFANILFFNKNNNKFFKFGFLVSAICSLLANFMSGTRISLILLIVPFLLIIILKIINKEYKSLLIYLFCFLTLLSLIFTFVPQSISQRYIRGVNSFKYFFNPNVNTDKPQSLNAIGFSTAFRLKSWQVSWQLFKKEPFFGYGIGDFTKSFRNYTDKHNIESLKTTKIRTSKYYNPHSVYFFLVVSIGLFGLIFSILVFFLIPIWLAIKNTKNNNNLETTALTIALILIFAGAGLTDYFIRSSFASIYLFFLPLLMSFTFEKDSV